MEKKALVLIDTQNEYFPGGGLELVAQEEAALAVRSALEAARKAGILVVHVRHENLDPAAKRFRAGSSGAQIHSSLAPLESEAVVTKHRVDSFAQTGLEDILRRAGLVPGKGCEIAVCGSMIHMCVDAFLRAATARDYSCALLADACATRDLEWGGRSVAAADVKAAFYSAFAFFGARMTSAQEWAKVL
jgi:nicotinamidase-related amidase